MYRIQCIDASLAPTEAPTCDACHKISFGSEKSMGRKSCGCTIKQCEDTYCSPCQSPQPLPADECGCRKYKCVEKMCPQNQIVCHPCEGYYPVKDQCDCQKYRCGSMNCLELPPNSTICEDVDECGCPTEDCIKCPEYEECPETGLFCENCQVALQDRCYCNNGCGRRECPPVARCGPGQEEVTSLTRCGCETVDWCKLP